MSFGPQVVMPGAFHFEAPNGTPMPGVHPGIFRPPISSSPSNSMYLGKSTGNFYSDAMTPGQNTKRKRRGYGESTPMNDIRSDYDGTHEEKTEMNRYAGEGGRRYVLAGHMESPNGVAPTDMNSALEDSVYSDIDYRRVLASKRPHSEIEPSTNYATLTQPSPSQSQPPNGWGSFALNTIGGVVGKVFDFCTVGVFRGFYAGGGRGYDMNTPPQFSNSNGQVWCNEHDIPTLPSLDPTGTSSGFPQSDYSPFQYERETPESTPPPAAKRRQINDGLTGDEGLGRNWVMVQDQPETTRPQSRASRAPTNYTHQQQAFAPVLRRRIGRPVSRVSTPNFARRQSGRMSLAGSVSLPSREPASFASPRAQSPAPAYTPSRIPIPSRPQTPCAISPARLSQHPSFIPSPCIQPKRSHQRTHSTASAASAPSNRMKRRDSVQEIGNNSPRLDAEAKNLAARRIQEEMETDWKMNDLNARLRDMIRQGKEALGTTIEVDGDGDVGGLDHWESE
ncbi:uncharacterized protein GGS22DRAFT_63098 [Annulohypoxylon maeteangense]|uniref:uncharacterized protein n=1 Tax=Annulohypoxylon maeteangense TaxID=1927788 RepID=UPI0020077097|nr:uncharacterized protein GGS22DRAFT_63098 [Annulohypoxylon maeteangense]KAI0888794.1 hypothetical protein GGS22DRAFT_63098 [Annulohypoxylon maeteangense]